MNDELEQDDAIRLAVSINQLEDSIGRFDFKQIRKNWKETSDQFISVPTSPADSRSIGSKRMSKFKMLSKVYIKSASLTLMK